MDYLDQLRTKLVALLDERQAAKGELDALLAGVAAEQRADLTDDESATFTSLRSKIAQADEAAKPLESRIGEIEAEIAAADAAAEKVRRYQPQGRPGRETATSTDDPFARGREFGAPHEVRDAAFRAIERVSGLTPEHRAGAEKLIRSVDTPDGRLARHILITGRDEYRSAFQKMMAGRPELMLDDERRAVMEARTSGLTDGQGGVAVPFTLDPSVIHTATYAGAMHPWREIATVTPVVTDNWNGVASSGVTASMAGEAEEVVDANPTFTQPSIAVKKAQAFVQYTEEIYADWASYESEIRDMFMWAKEVLEDSQFTLGSGTGNNVNGIVTDLVAASTPIVASAGANTLGVADVYAMENALAKRFRGNASWVAARTVYNVIRAADTNGGGGLWERIGAGMPAQLLGYPIYEGENIDSSYGSGENYVLIFGDVRQCYRIVDRVGMTIQNFPALMGSTNNLPNGTGGLRLVWRFGAKAVNTTACKILNVT